MPIRRIRTLVDKLKAASEAHAGQSKELMDIYMGINQRRRKLCNIAFFMAEKADKAGRPDLSSDAAEMFKGLECEEF